MKSKKLLAGILAASMVFSLAACGSSEGAADTSDQAASTTTTEASSSQTTESTASETTTEEASSEVDMTPLSVTIMVPSDDEHTETDENYDRLVQELNDYLQMDITWEFRAQDGYYDSIDLMITSGDVPDIMVVGKDATFLSAAQEGLFWDLTDYIDDYDNLSTIPEATRANCSINGQMYALPRSRTLARNGFGYRLDWLNNLGLKEPETWDEFYDMLYAFKYNDPDGNGVDDTEGLYLDSWTGSFDIMQVWFGVPNGWGIDENGDLIPAHLTDEYKTALAAFRQLYADGLIEENFNDSELHAAGSARNEGLRTSIGGAGIQVLDDLRKVETYFEGDDVGLTDSDNPIFTLGGYIDTGLGAYCLPTTGYNNMIAISTKNIKTEEQLRRVLQMLNDINDYDCKNLIDYGFEGVTYDINEDGYIELYDSETLEANGTSTTFRNGFNQIIPYFTAEENITTTVAPASTPITILEQQLYADDVQYCVTNYGASYTSQYYIDHGTDLDTIISEARTQYIIGEIDESGLDEAINTWLTAGGQTVIDEMNEAYHAAGN